MILAISPWSRSAAAAACMRAKLRTTSGFASVVVPEHAGVLSALGMLMADRVRDYTAGVLGRDVELRCAGETRAEGHAESHAGAITSICGTSDKVTS